MITFWTPLVEVQWEMDLPLEKILVANAMWAADLSAAIPDHVARIESILGKPPQGGHWPLSTPYHYDPVTKRTSGISTCGLVFDGIAERSGVAWPWAGQPYHAGTALARDEAFARREETVVQWDQWQPAPTADSDLRPGPGDGVVMGLGLATHIGVCVRWEGDVMISVDGGQALAEDRWLQSIRVCRRQWRLFEGKWFVGSRPLHGWVRTYRLPWVDRFQAPMGWEEVPL